MDNVRTFCSKLVHLLGVYPEALRSGWRERHVFRSLKTTCLFVGYPRSGHSLIGALLDAHPDAVIAHEADILKYVFARFSRSQLLYLMRRNSQVSAASGRNWQGYSYQVPGQWQGRHRTLRVIGDKHGESTTVRLMLQPGLLDRVERSLGPDVRFIHVVRNPYDNIATMLRKGTDRFTDGIIERSADSLRDSIRYYFALCQGVALLKARIGDRMLEVRHEDVVARPSEALSRICQFLGLEPSPQYLADCAAVVFAEPHRSRHEAPWTAEAIDIVTREAARFRPLDGYTFEGL